jgi:hypothetical protein
MRRPLLITLAATLPIGLSLLPAATSPAQANAGAISTPAAVTATGRPVFDQARPGPAVSNCSRALRYSVRHSHKVVSCVTIGTPARGAGNAIPQSGFPGVSCDSLPTGVWYYGRFQMCLEAGFYYEILLNGQVLGRANFSDAQQLDFSATSLQWTESDYARLDSVSGDAVDNSLGWVTNCSGACTPASRTLWPVTPIAVGQTLHGSTTFSGTPASGSSATLSATPTVTVVDPAATPAAYPITLFKSLGVRCDNGLAVTNSAGCVIPTYTPTLSISRATYGSSAAMISWAQHNLSSWGLPGSGQPLHRLASDTEANKNRAVICDSTFVYGSTGVANDSCDEFPFAKTYESGARHGVTSGSQCTQVTAIRTAPTGTDAEQWAKISVLSVRSGPCIRGHIPQSLNYGVGGALGRFTQAQRLIDHDPYWLAVTS